MNRNKTLPATILLIGTLLLSGVCAAAATTTDPIGDFSFPDITELTATVSEGDLIVVITCTDSLIDMDITGAVFIDADQNYTTGYHNDTGSDYVYTYNVIDIVYTDPIKSVAINDDTVDSNTLDVAGNQISITIPLTMLGNDDGDMDIFVATHTQFVKALNFDRAPDFGVLNTLNGSVRIPHPGNSLAGGTIADLAGDSTSPDMTGLDVDVENGIVNIVVTYNQNVEPDDLSYGEDLTGWIFVDADQDLATGFTNTEQAPPTYGIDYRIEYVIGRLTETDVSITKIDYESDLTESGFTQTKGVLLGVPYNDATFKVVANQVFLGIPLGLLGYDDGNMDVVIDSFTLYGLLSGDIDSAPDFGYGALDTSDGSIKPLLSCTGHKVTITDPAGDSSGFGLDGDDLTGVAVCSAGNVLLVTVAYSSLSLDDGAVTTVAFDTDQDPDSLPDYSFIYFMYEGNLGANIVGDFGEGPDVRDATHLITMLGNKMYLSIPAEFLGNDDGAMNMHVETAIEAGDEDLIYDRAPDTGFISINGPIKGDLNNDGKITTSDAAIALRIAIGTSPYDGAADVNNDHKVTSLDVLMILQAAAGAIGL
ncbi:MAG: dockerin type I repeat-containing protein [Euryarchaeota archaeon]|nr:dockerin type I repeat-containing protein [Euryarchaeota archaeon]